MKPHTSLSRFGLIARAVLLLAGSGCASIKERFARVKSPPPPPPARFEPTPVEGLPPVDPALLQRPTSEFRIGPGDQLEIEVLGDVEKRAITTIGTVGRIYLSLLPGIHVGGLTFTPVLSWIPRGQS